MYSPSQNFSALSGLLLLMYCGTLLSKWSVKFWKPPHLTKPIILNGNCSWSLEFWFYECYLSKDGVLQEVAEELRAHVFQAEAVHVEVLVSAGDALFGQFVGLVVQTLQLLYLLPRLSAAEWRRWLVCSTAPRKTGTRDCRPRRSSGSDTPRRPACRLFAAEAFPFPPFIA